MSSFARSTTQLLSLHEEQIDVLIQELLKQSKQITELEATIDRLISLMELSSENMGAMIRHVHNK